MADTEQPTDPTAVVAVVMGCDEPCVGMVGEWTCLRRATTAPTVLCDRCERLQQAVEWAMARAQIEFFLFVMDNPPEVVTARMKATDADAAEKWSKLNE